MPNTELDRPNHTKAAWRFSCALPANWLRRLDLATLIRGKPRHVRAGTAATQPLSSRARSRQALRLVPLRAEQEAAVLRRVAYRHGHRAVHVHGGADRDRASL